MTFMSCRNRVKDYDNWKAVFDSHADLHKKAGMKLTNVWRDVNDDNNIFFNFIVDTIKKVEAIVNMPESVNAGEKAGVVDGEYYYTKKNNLNLS